jgi:predicted metal-dependent hydrolase
MAGKQIHFKDIGDILFVKNSKARNLRITINPANGIKVTVPRFASMDNAFRFVEEKKKWIKNNLEKYKNYRSSQTIFQPGTEFRTYKHELFFENTSDTDLKAKIKEGRITILYPSVDILLSQSGQNLVRKAIEYALRLEAKAILPDRIAQIAKKYGFNYKSTRFKNLKSRWGSCSSAGNINLNIHLMRLPDHLINYVILHELVHTVHRNHGKGFWDMLNALCGDAKGLRNEMRQYQTRIY